jgi:hypothetical protein
MSGEKKYYLANLASEDRPAHLSNHHQGALGLRAAHQQMKEERPFYDRLRAARWRAERRVKREPRGA